MNISLFQILSYLTLIHYSFVTGESIFSKLQTKTELTETGNNVRQSNFTLVTEFDKAGNSKNFYVFSDPIATA